MNELIKKNKQQYISKFGTYPTFKAGLHVGDALIARVGEIKKEIVYIGDVVNTAARLQGECNTLGEIFLTSQEVIDIVPNKNKYEISIVK